LFDSSISVDILVQFSGYFRDAFKLVTEASEESGIPQIGSDQDGRETSFAPAQVIRGFSGPISITIMGGDALADKAFKVILRWMVETCESGEIEELSNKLSFTDLTHCVGVVELLAVPMVLKDQVYRKMASIADDQIPLEGVKTLYAHAMKDHPAREMAIESIGNAYREKRLKNEKGYYEHFDENEDFKKDLQQYIHKSQVDSIPTTEGQSLSPTGSIVSDCNSEDGTFVAGGGDMNWGPSTTVTATPAQTCGSEAFKYSHQAHIPKPILSFDGPADEWTTQTAATGGDWNAGATEWQDTSAAAGGVDDGWANTGGGSNDGNGWGDDTGGAGGATFEDDNTCRRCKQPGHFARECPVPRNDSCFNCGQPGHISRDCTEPKKPRADDRSCRKCNEVGHIARDCPTGAGGGGDRACHKCGETGHIARDCPTGGGGGDRACHKCGETGHIARDCTSCAFGAAAGGAGGGMKCYNCQEYGHKSSECTNEPVEREYGSDPRTCNKCGQKGHISRDCRGDSGDSYSMQHGGGYGDQYDSGYGGGGYDGQAGLFNPAADADEYVEPPQEQIVNVTVSAPRVRKGKKGRPGYVDITQQMYDPRAFDGPDYNSYNGGGQRGEGRGGRGGRSGRGGGRGGRRNGEDGGGHGADFGNENVPPANTDVPAVAVEGGWADAEDGSAPAAAAW
jgi:cellular nucleic acid-binding protein